MKIEKICEYFNDIGLIQLENINRFLKIYTQLSQNKYKNKSDKLILALFSYITLVSKNEQQLYDICKNIVNSFSNNQILSRYKALNMFNNIIKYKLNSRYILFFSRLNSFIYNKKGKNKYIHLNPKSKLFNSNSNKLIKNDFLNNDNFICNTSIGKNNEKKNPKIKPKIIKIHKNKNYYHNNNFKNIYNISDDDKECTFSPKINHYYNKPKYQIKINNNSEYYSSYNNSNDNIDNNDNSFTNKFIPFKNSINYGYNNKINNEIEKMLFNMSKYSNNQNNTKYLPQKTIYRKQINNIYPSNSYNKFPGFENDNNNDNDYNNNNNNDMVYHYYDEDYDFYENEREHLKKVQDKILQLKLEKLDKISKECTFSPEINKIPNYLYYNKNNLTENNITHRNFYNNNYMNNSFINNRKLSKNKKSKINEEYNDDYYNVPKNTNKNRKQRPKSYSGSKDNNGYSIYKNRKEELSKLFKEQYPFVPNIKYNKNVKIYSTFDERQQKLIKDKEELYKQKEKEEIAQMKEFQKMNHRSKTDSKEVVKRLYNGEQIKEKVEKEKKEKSKKKNVINWSKKRKNYNKKYPNDFKNNIIKKNKKPNINNEENKKEDKVIDFNNFAKNKKDKSKEKLKEVNDIIDFDNFAKENQIYNKKKNKNDNNNKGEINNNKNLLMDKIKDEHVIGFKNNIPNNSYNFNNFGDSQKDEEKESLSNNIKSLDSNSNNNFGSGSLNFEEKMKNYEENRILDNFNDNFGIKSKAFQQIRDKQNNK